MNGTVGTPARQAGEELHVAGRLARRPPLIVAAGLLLFILIVAALVSPVLRPWDDRHIDLGSALQPPTFEHPMGTDTLGRDLLAQVLHGLRVSFAVSAAAALVAVLLGTAIGLVAGLVGGWVDTVLMRAVDIFQAQNHFLLSILLAVFFRPVLGPPGAIMLAVSLTHWVTVARIVRSQLLTLRERPFIAAAINSGASRWHLVQRHYLPHLLPAVSLAFVLLVPHSIFHESGLSFLGLGMPPHAPSLGSLLNESRQTLFTGGWWLAACPGAVIFLAAASIGLLGEYWRTRLHPHWRAELELG